MRQDSFSYDHPVGNKGPLKNGKGTVFDSFKDVKIKNYTWVQNMCEIMVL